MWILNNKGVTIIESMVIVAILGMLVSIAIPSYRELRKRSFQKQATAHLVNYHRSAKLMIAEFGFNPGNFEALGFRPEGDLYHRIVAADNTSDTLPDAYPNNDNCFSTNDTQDTSTIVNDCSDDFSTWWNETSSNYWDNNYTGGTKPAGTPSISGKEFFVYAYPPGDHNTNTESDYLCASHQKDVFVGNCQ